MGRAARPATPNLATSRLLLMPLQVADADEMALVLADPALYVHAGGEPPTPGELHVRYARQCAGDPAGKAEWHNWIIRVGGRAIGYIQATVNLPPTTPPELSADLAWVVGAGHQRLGYAREASAAAVDWLVTRAIADIGAWVGPANTASQAVARGLGMRPTSQVADGETRWRLFSPLRRAPGPADAPAPCV